MVGIVQAEDNIPPAIVKKNLPNSEVDSFVGQKLRSTILLRQSEMKIRHFYRGCAQQKVCISGANVMHDQNFKWKGVFA